MHVTDNVQTCQNCNRLVKTCSGHLNVRDHRTTCKTNISPSPSPSPSDDVSSTAGVSKSKHDQVGAHTQGKFSNRATIGCDMCPRSRTSRELIRQAHSTCRGHIPIKPCQLCSRNKARMTTTEGRLNKMQTS